MRIILVFVLVVSIIFVPVGHSLAAAQGPPAAPASAQQTTAKNRILWTIVGAAGGFGLGLLGGLSALDDEPYAEGKILGVAGAASMAGGMLGYLYLHAQPSAISRDFA